MKTSILYIALLFFSASIIAQKDSLSVKNEKSNIVIKDTLATQEYDALAPQRAAFYSAVLPGLGQAYNKKYWKIPVIYGGMAAGVYFYIQNDNDYNRFRDAFKRRLAGFTDDEFFGAGEEATISNERLIDAQKNARQNRDVSVIVTLAFYLINIVDANVDAHLRQYNVDDNLSIEPNFKLNEFDNTVNYGLSFKFNLE
ncbi:DUF5683 domain-containing protein [Patiriisocius sp. Uisw_017]|uniref:DUF5683 domain-containing protein n=1 Tax=Patiriisocius sp. Uisw_017 TaxID=3230968 RepID=UPI0039EBA451